MPIRHLDDDYYRYDPETHSLVGQNRRKVFQVGNPVTVEVLHVQAEKREIDFILPELNTKGGRVATRQKMKNRKVNRHRAKGRRRH